MPRSSDSMRLGSMPVKRLVPGEARWAPASNRSDCACASSSSHGDAGQLARAVPMNEFSSSIVP